METGVDLSGIGEGLNGDWARVKWTFSVFYCLWGDCDMRVADLGKVLWEIDKDSAIFEFPTNVVLKSFIVHNSFSLDEQYDN